MKITIQSVLKTFALFISWLIFSPLFLVFSIIWKMPRLGYRIVLTLVAPLSLLVLLLTGLGLADMYQKYFVWGTRTELETKTGITFPDWQVTERRSIPKPFRDDYLLKVVVQLDTFGIEDFYYRMEQKMDSIKDNDNVIFLKNSEGYSYSGIHGDKIIRLSISKKTGLMEIDTEQF